MTAMWREDRKLLSYDAAGEARMCYSAALGPNVVGAIYETADGACTWYLLASGQEDSLEEAQDAVERTARNWKRMDELAK